MRCESEFILETEEPEKIYQALAPELEDEVRRSGIDLVVEENSIRLKIRGEDVVSFRAALNTWIRLAKIAFEMVSI